MDKIPTLSVRGINVNLIQGPMGVGISGKNLASSVANAKGIKGTVNERNVGMIAAVGLGTLKGYPGSYEQANIDALRDEIRTAKKISNGIIGVNMLYALTDFEGLVKTAVEENIDLITTGAGISRDFPRLVNNSKIKIIPIVSSLRLAKYISKSWKKYGRTPDAFIVEGPKAGGHLGFNYSDLINGTTKNLESIIKEVIDFANNSFDNPIPVFGAGGIYTGKDIAKYEKFGAAGVQMATRFVTTLECDASDKFKQTYLVANKKDIVFIESPVGMPGRVINNQFVENLKANGRQDFSCGYHCLKTCKPKESLYCIAEALIEAQRGNLSKGFAFAGENAYMATRENCLDSDGDFITVETLIKRLSEEYNKD